MGLSSSREHKPIGEMRYSGSERLIFRLKKSSSTCGHYLCSQIWSLRLCCWPLPFTRTLPTMAFPFYGKNGPMILWVMWIETIIASLILCARMYTRTMIVHGMGWDDHLIVVTQVTTQSNLVRNWLTTFEVLIHCIHSYLYCGSSQRNGKPCCWFGSRTNSNRSEVGDCCPVVQYSGHWHK